MSIVDAADGRKTSDTEATQPCTGTQTCAGRTGSFSTSCVAPRHRRMGHQLAQGAGALQLRAADETKGNYSSRPDGRRERCASGDAAHEKTEPIQDNSCGTRVAKRNPPAKTSINSKPAPSVRLRAIRCSTHGHDNCSDTTPNPGAPARMGLDGPARAQPTRASGDWREPAVREVLRR